ncbi:outer membrane lipoprotein carrier protein LolA [Paenibacillus sp. Marseille-Q4541]|uniref:LolA family protein n=1 Tax=Paenibacillus sp. Marseille-Q4541 TaxID=2831522 RepID=UPI001BA9A900|nr:outer membrane lipoprotein carrier protein LolA [Paenibacillus sp. Marseille-Q4541]
MRRISWIIAMVLCFSGLLTACGPKDAESVVKDLNEVVGDLESYQGSGVMTLYSGETPQEYKVEVWHQKPSYYRIALTNAKKNITQIVLRNDDGVFVLTPSLNKSFRFQSNWPDDQGQVYLYETLVRSIVGDNARQFADEDDSYVFDVAANYNTHSLVRQKIWLDKENYSPKHVAVSDANANVVVDVKFDKFEFGTKFEKESFDMQRNMSTGAGQNTTPEEGNTSTINEDVNTPEVTVPESGDKDQGSDQPDQPQGGQPGDEVGGEVDPDDSATLAPGAEEEEASSELGDFGVIEPTYLPNGVNMKDEPTIMETADDYAVMLRYEGTYNYTIIEARPQDRASSYAATTPVDLGFTIGMMTTDLPQTLTWFDEGMEYRITSDNLPVAEMVQIAASMQDQSGK